MVMKEDRLPSAEVETINSHQYAKEKKKKTFLTLWSFSAGSLAPKTKFSMCFAIFTF